MKKIVLPKKFYKYFWDVDCGKINVSLHQKYIIEKLIQWGDVEGWKWLATNYSKKTIAQVVLKAKEIDNRTKRLYCLINNLDEKSICKQTPSIWVQRIT